jgi:epoxyqueuosine reductase
MELAVLTAKIAQLGVARFGIARAEPLTEESERLRAWLDAGRHGTMTWMEETADVRADVRHEGMLPSAQSVIVLVAPYARDDARVGPFPGRVARYARGRDYHNVLGKRANKLAAFLRKAGYRARGTVDSHPVYERAWARRAGVGFIGKNSCLIIPGLGSHVFLATVITDAPLPASEPMSERCGSCTRCLDACPTRAFVGPRELDARRCISYLTIEHRGDAPDELKAQLGDWFLGCDVCQDVCPFNRTQPPADEVTSAFAPDARWDTSCGDLLEMSQEQFDPWSLGSPVRRLGLESAARNAAWVLGNTGDKRHLPVLRRAAAHPNAVVRQAAVWAQTRLEAASRDDED